MTSIPDIDALQLASQESLAPLELLKLLTDASRDAVAIKSRELKYLACNAAFLRMCGRREEEVIGKTDTELSDEQTAALCRQSDLLVLETGEVIEQEEYIRNEPGEIWIHIIKAPWRDSEGTIQGLVLTSRDITEQKLAEESVGRQAERYLTLLNTTVDGYWLVDTRGALLDVNQGYCNMSGYTREELLMMHIPDLEAKECPEETALHIQAIMRSGFERFTSRHRRKDGEIIDVEISTSFLAHRGEFLGFVRDITERTRAESQRRRYEEKLQEARQLAERESQAKTRFLATASHDLRQPIQAMHLLSDLLVNTELPVESAEIAFRVKEAVEGLGEMLTALLDISKLDAGLIKTEISEFRFNDLALQLASEYLPLAKERGFELRTVKSSVSLRSDQHLLTRILRNLLSNAIKYTQAGSVLIGLRRHGETAHIQVFDTGIGIGEDELEKVFEEFHQLGNTARDRREGLGLGLAIVHRLACLLDHRVEVYSQPGRGTCFSITVPMASASEEQREWLPEDELILPVPHEGAEILVVEDEIDIRQGLEMNLKQWGYAVSVAADYGQAMQAYQEELPPVLIIADYRLGARTGIDVIRELRQRSECKIPALLLTGDATEERAQEASRHGVLVLRKPVSGVELRRAVVDCLTTPQCAATISL